MEILTANKNNKKLRIGLFGQSGFGKSHSALTMARAFGEKVIVIDSEDGAANVFSDLYKFDVLQLPDTSIHTYIKAIETVSKHQYDCVVIDSLTHAWQWALGQVSQERNTQLGWGRMSPIWDKMFHSVKRLNANVIVTMRSKVRVQDGKSFEDFDARENTDYDFDLILKVKGLSKENNLTVCKGEVTKTRLNLGTEKLKVGSQINLSSGLIQYILKWQSGVDNAQS